MYFKSTKTVQKMMNKIKRIINPFLNFSDYKFFKEKEIYIYKSINYESNNLEKKLKLFINFFTHYLDSFLFF
jgi:hypothetical protein